MWRLAAHLRSRLVLALTFIDHLPQQVVAGPGQIFDFGGELRPRRRLYSTHVPGKTAVAELRILDMIHGRN